MLSLNIAFCSFSVCGDNMDFRYAVRTQQPTCAEPWLSGLTDNGDKGFGCVCNDGFLLSGTECVREEQCGCTVSNMYRPVSFDIILDDINLDSLLRVGSEYKIFADILNILR